MPTIITTIQEGDLISGSRTDINNNFDSVLNNKIETSVLDTDTTLAANSDSKIATQKATKAYVDASVNPTGRSWNEYAADAGSTDAYAITLTGVSAYTTGQTFKFKANTANTGAATLNINGLGAKTIKKEVSSDLSTGDILANQLVVVTYDGTNMQLTGTPPSIIPIMKIYRFLGNSSSQFDMTNTVGNTWRYTWDGNGTDPGITATTIPIGMSLTIAAQNFTEGGGGNNGTFTVTGSGANYFEVTNASGQVESNKTIGTGYILINSTTYTKPSGLKYVVVEVVGGGGGGGTATSNNDGVGSGGGGGGYSRKLIAAATLGATETVTIGAGGAATVTGGTTSFGSHLQATGGVGGVDRPSAGALGGVGSGGNINIEGGDGGVGAYEAGANGFGGNGGSSYFGGGGSGSNASAALNGNVYGGGGGGGGANNSADANGGTGASGVVIVTEYY